MSAPIDVLAVWDREIEAFANTKAIIDMSVPERAHAYATQLAVLREARAAVAELIEASRWAAEKLFAMSREMSSPRFTDRYGDGPEMRKRADALFAAIAKATQP